MAKILISGYLGLIGSRIYHELKSRGEQVYGYDYGDKMPSDRIEYDMIIHCAANCIIRETIHNPDLMMENIDLTYMFMELARRTECKQVILFSSGRLNYPENSNPYIVSKQFLENIAKAYKQCYGINSVIVRPETVWDISTDNPKRVIPNWILSAKSNKRIIVYGDSNKELSPIHINDFYHEFTKILSNFDKYANREPITITGIALKVCDIISGIKKQYRSTSEVKYVSPEDTQPQNCQSEGHNIVRVSGFYDRLKPTNRLFGKRRKTKWK